MTARATRPVVTHNSSASVSVSQVATLTTARISCGTSVFVVVIEIGEEREREREREKGEKEKPRFHYSHGNRRWRPNEERRGGAEARIYLVGYTNTIPEWCRCCVRPNHTRANQQGWDSALL